MRQSERWTSWARGSSAALAAVSSLLVPARALAVNFEVSGDVVAQGYDVAGPWGDYLLGRQRLVSTLGLYAYNLQGDYAPNAPDYSIRLRMRIDADFGIDPAESSFDAATANRFVPGLDRFPVDMMYGYVEGRNLLGGLLGFRLGRQYAHDVLGWWSFDGGLVRIVTPFFVQAEVYAGLEQRGGLPLSTPRFEQQGIWRGSHRGFEDQQQQYPSFQFAGPAAPAFGFALESNGPNYIHGRFSYRRVYNLGEAFTNQFPTAGGGFEKVEGSRISSERLGYAATAFLDDLGGVRGGFAYDLYNDLVSRAYGGLDVHIANLATLSADVDFFVPTFDGDSIFNWFTHNPNTTMQLRAMVRPTDRLQLTGGGGVRLWVTDGDPATYFEGQCASDPNGGELLACIRDGYDPTRVVPGVPAFSRVEANRGTDLAPDLLANLGAAYRWGSGNAGVDGMLQQSLGGDADFGGTVIAAGYRGRRTGAALFARQMVVGDMFWVNGRASVFNWDDPLREHRNATSFTYVLAPELEPADFMKLRVEWEHSVNELVGQRFRMLGMVQMAVPESRSPASSLLGVVK